MCTTWSCMSHVVIFLFDLLLDLVFFLIIQLAILENCELICFVGHVAQEFGNDFLF